MKLKARYQLNKETKVGTECICPSCGEKFIKQSYQQVFCKTKAGTQCKDKYWNTVTPTKKNNTTRISPASEKWLTSHMGSDEAHDDYRLGDDDHPFSSEGLGQN